MACRQAAAVVMLMVAISPHALAAGDAVHGEEVYQTCTPCHSLDRNDVGPRHRDVFGRRAAAVVDYQYSPALRQSGLTWSEDMLDKWLADPQALVPGSKMLYWVEDARDRADVIAYLKKIAGDRRATLPSTAR